MKILKCYKVETGRILYQVWADSEQKALEDCRKWGSKWQGAQLIGRDEEEEKREYGGPINFYIERFFKEEGNEWQKN